MDDDGTNEVSEQRAATSLVHRNEASPASVTPTVAQDGQSASPTAAATTSADTPSSCQSQDRP
eukprot:2626441-Pyramimonas_sp.AAC.1